MAITTEMRTEVSQLYVAMFGRAPDEEGLGFWTQQLGDGRSVTDVANTMYATAPARAYFPSYMTNGEIIASFYINVLGRAGDAEGLAYWTAKLNASGATPGSVIAEMINVVANYTGTDPDGLTSAALFNNKVEVAQYYGEHGGDVSGAGSILASVTSDPATVDAAIDSIGTNTGAFTLTNGTDVATANTFEAGLVWSPGGNDRINALQDEDSLTGVGTNPTLNATLGNANDNGGTIITPKLAGIETINVAFTGSGNAGVVANNAVTDLDLQDATGVDAINISRVTQAVDTAEVGNIQDAVSTMSIHNTHANLAAGTVEFSFGTNVLAGENAGTLTLDNVGLNVVNVGQNTSGIGVRGVGARGYETLNIVSTGAANTVGTMNLPMDTGTAGSIVITGDTDLTLGANANIVNNANAALVEAAGVWTVATGIAQAGGRVASIDASGLDGNLTLVLDNVLDVGKAGTSGVVQNVTVTGGAGNDTFVLYDAIQAGDSVNGGDGADTLLFYAGSSIASAAGSIEAANFFVDGSTAAATAQPSADFDFLPAVTGTTIRNISNAAGANAAEAAITVTLYDMTAAQAAGITVQHATTGNNQIANTTVEAAVKANTAADTLGLTIAEGTNVNPRFNFTIDTVVANTATSTTAAASTFENVTITDSDSESNSVELNNFAQHTGTITLTGGVAGTFLNLDVDTAGADVTANTLSADGLAAGVQQGLYGLNTDGAAVELATGSAIDVGLLATQVRIGAATINAAAEASNVIVRVSTNAASVVGAQAITMGTGNDTVIFDNLNDTRAGLTISDTVAGGTGTDTLVIDGNGVNVNLGASEWTNVTGFETIRTVGLGVGSTYNLTLTDALIDANAADGNLINIINDNDVANDTASAADTVTIAASQESAVTIDARTLSATNSFTYNGEEGATRTADRFILADANINGKAVIDGGAVDNVVLTNSVANADVIEVRNAAVVTAGDLANVKNVGIIAFNNDQATAQRLTLQLNDTVIDSMVDSYHVAAATAGQIETLNVTLADAGVVEVAGVGLDLDVTGITGKSALSVALNTAAAGAATDNIQLSASGGIVTISNGAGAAAFETTADGAGVTGATLDKIVLSKTAFAAITSVAGAGFSVGAEFQDNGTAVAAAAGVRIIFDNTTGNLWYDADGNGVGQAVQIATLTGIADLAAADFTIIA